MVEDRPRGANDGEQPPFLTEPTRVTVEGSSPQINDRLSDLFDRFRPGLLALAIPVIAIAGAVIYLNQDNDNQPAAEQAAEAATTTQVVVTSEQPASSADDPEVRVLAVAASEPAFSEPIPAEGFATTAPPPPPPPVTKATTTTTPTTAAPTTEAPTTAPPPTDPPDLCKVRIAKTVNLKDEPRNRGDNIGEVLPGAYPAVGARGNWVQINVAGTVGWIRSGVITEITGNC